MRVHLDRTACQGHGRCYSLAPDVFTCDDDGQAVLLVDGPLSSDQEVPARLAADSCPEFAITVE
ncbi:ferredoxin [Iamia majanohamensis]|uniref:Ferredoxin n=1 Tax=Iamia majanohamensis TaxID=467976 RepID=A0AAE9Y7C3_9ACTN|nr:ferredoxin [Iamia majanohamensis]WCO65748.1 ferredoxin [Iamia majanohamensis]